MRGWSIEMSVRYMKRKKLYYIICAVLITIQIIFYNSFAFIPGNGPVKIDAKKIVDAKYGYEKSVRLNYQLTRLKQLNSLSLDVEKNDDLSCLKKLINLESLSIYAIDELAQKECDLKSLSQVTDIKNLSLCWFIKEDIDFSFLEEFESLEELSSLNSNIWNWGFVGKLNNLTKIRIVMFDEYNDFKWDGLSFSRSLEEFEASGIYFDKTLLENLEDTPSIKKVDINFTDYSLLNGYDKDYINKWIDNMKCKGVDVNID